MSEIKLDEVPTLTFEPFEEEPQLPVQGLWKAVLTFRYHWPRRLHLFISET